VDNPFRATTHNYNDGDIGKNLNSIKASGERTGISKNTLVNHNPKPAAETYSSAMSPSIASITARMEALELHSLIPSTGEEGQVNLSAIREKTVRSLMSDDEFKYFIKNIVREANDEKVYTRKPFKNNRRTNYDNEGCIHIGLITTIIMKIKITDTITILKIIVIINAIITVITINITKIIEANTTTLRVHLEMSKESVRIILPKYYTFINDTSFGCIYTHSLL
jgi:hypothetical protein